MPSALLPAAPGPAAVTLQEGQGGYELCLPLCTGLAAAAPGDRWDWGPLLPDVLIFQEKL